MSSALRFLPLLLAALLAVANPSVAQPVDALVRDIESRVRPERGDWRAEALQASAKQALLSLAEVIATEDWTGLSACAHESAVSTALAPLAPADEHGAISVARQSLGHGPSPSGTLEVGLRALRRRLPQAPLPRITFKVTGIAVEAPNSFTTTVRYEAFTSAAEGFAVQHTGAWWVSWLIPSPESQPQLAAIRLLDLEEVTTQRPLFVECTSNVIDLTKGRSRLLSNGGEWWHGRVDGVGEPNLMGHQGTAIGDVNGDGLEDLYVAMGTGLPNLLLIRQADGTLRDRAEEAGVAWLDDTKGVLFADTDNDGDQDLVMAIGNAVVLAKNRGNGTFDRIVTMRAATPASFYSLAVCDYDKDGDLDIYGCRYVKVQYGVSVPRPFHDANNGPTNHLLRNEGADRFVDVTNRVGLGVNNTRFSLACTWFDHDGDGDMDLYVANDFGRNNLYSQERGRFVDVAAKAGVEDQAAGMGVSVGDFDLDGKRDLYVTNMYSAAGSRVTYQTRFESAAGNARDAIRRFSVGNSLFRNTGGGRFEDVSRSAGVRMGRWGWGARFCDLDNDGFDDIVAPNGFLTGRVKDDL